MGWTKEEFGSIPSRAEYISSSPKRPDPALGPTKLPIQKARVMFSPGTKAAGA
jgi:hypothetical protein